MGTVLIIQWLLSSEGVITYNERESRTKFDRTVSQFTVERNIGYRYKWKHAIPRRGFFRNHGTFLRYLRRLQNLKGFAVRKMGIQCQRCLYASSFAVSKTIVLRHLTVGQIGGCKREQFYSPAETTEPKVWQTLLGEFQKLRVYSHCSCGTVLGVEQKKALDN